VSNKALIFDLDGVLVDSKELHFKALNLALAEQGPWFIISGAEQKTTYEGLTTRDKLEILNKTKGLAKDKFDEVWLSKQEHTAKLFDGLGRDDELVAIFKRIKERGFKLAVVSNSIRQTLDVCLSGLGIGEFVDLSLSNEEVPEVKPSPGGYQLAMNKLGVVSLTTAVFEDSVVGRLAAIASGAKLVAIESRKSVTMELVEKTMDDLEKKSQDITILVPMAGAGSRFAEKGYTKPKFFIDVNGAPMIQPVIYSLDMNGNYVYLAQKKDSEEYGLRIFLRNLCPYAPKVTVIELDGMTDGAASTSLLARHEIDNDAPLIICNSDQIVEWDSKEFLEYAGNNNLDGCIAVFESDDPRWSYAKVNDGGRVTQVAEKEVISELATVGIYYWKRGSDYVRYAEKMISKDIRTNGEFYICPVYNEAIADGRKIGVFKVDRMISLGTPEDLEEYVGSQTDLPSREC
jgi:beta-phosphoglucomutase-like phosphatase (HAD superfamily)/dTDP-glucose pyrophosphorylase